MSKPLEAENARLREEVERLRAIVYPPPPPLPAAEPERQRLYLIAVDMNEKMAPRMAPILLESVRKRIPEADWQIAYRVEDMPEDGVGVLMLESMKQMWDGEDKEIRWYFRQGDKLQRFWTDTQIERQRAKWQAESRLWDRQMDHMLRAKWGKRVAREYRQQVNRNRYARRMTSENKK